MRNFLLLLCSYNLFIFNPIRAQDTLSFNNCLIIAIENNLSLKEALLEEDLSEVEYKRRKNDIYPNLNANISNNNFFGRSIDPYSNSYLNSKIKSYSGSIGSNLILFNGLLKRNRIKLAKSEIELNQNLIENIKNDISISLASLYTNILYTDELINLNKEQIELSEEQRDFIKVRYDEGLIPESELFRIQAQIAVEELNLTTNENLLKLYYIDLKQLMNIPIGENIILRQINFEDSFKKSDDLMQLNIEDTYIEYPSFKVSQIQENNAKIGIAISRAVFFPTVSLQFNYGSFYSDSYDHFNFSQQWNNNKNYGFGLSLSIPIFNGLSAHYDLKNAKITYEQTKIRTKVEKDRLIKILTQANNELISSHSKLKSALSAYTYAEKTFEADQLKFKYGKISLTELLRTQKDYHSNKAELIQARYEYIFNIGVIGFYKNDIFDIN